VIFGSYVVGLADEIFYLDRIYCLLNCMSQIMSRIYRPRFVGGDAQLLKVPVTLLPFFPQTE